MDSFFDRVKIQWEAFRNYCNGIALDWRENRKPRAVGKVILPCLPIVLVGLIVNFVVKNWNAIVTFFISIVTILCIIGGILNWYTERKRKWDEQKEQQRQEAIYENAQAQDRMYEKMGKAVWGIGQELGPEGIVPPNRLPDIYSPGRIIPKMGGEVLLGLYLLQKSRDNVDTVTLMTTMQTKADQKYKAGDFLDFDDKYDGLAIVRVKDSVGFVEVYTALINDSYRRYKLNCDLDRDVPPPSIDRRDMDY